MNVSVVIVAAGKGERLSQNLDPFRRNRQGLRNGFSEQVGALAGQTKKQFFPLSGKPILYWTLETFQKVQKIKEIILVLPEENIAGEEKTIKKKFPKLKKIVPGGKIRQESVFNGLKMVSPNFSLVAIHDGVRPLASEKLIRRTLQVAEKYGTAVAALPVKETVKMVSPGNIVQKTLPREKIWAIQTPQVFRREIIIRAHQKAKKDKFIGTDDAQLVERIGYKVRLVPGEETNIKITTPEDLLFARTLISAGFLKHR